MGDVVYGIVLPIWAWLIVLVISLVVWIAKKASQASERQRVAQRHRSMPSSMAAPPNGRLAPPAPPGSVDPSPPAVSPPAPGPVQDW